jgi:hypothetical protein
MSHRAVVAPEVTDGTGLARARQRFLAAEPVEPGQVRDTILASWQRSRQWNVAAGHIDPCYVRDPGPGTPLTRSALPVLQSLQGEGLEGQPVSVILTDARGVVLRRLTADHDLERHLDSIQLAPGFSYAELRAASLRAAERDLRRSGVRADAARQRGQARGAARRGSKTTAIPRSRKSSGMISST